jgi:hypothetical protein
VLCALPSDNSEIIQFLLFSIRGREAKKEITLFLSVLGEVNVFQEVGIE